MQISPANPRIVAVGLNGLLVTFSDELSDLANLAALSLKAEVDALCLTGVRETTTSLASTFVVYDPQQLPLSELKARIVELLQSNNAPRANFESGRKRWTIPAVFDDPDYGPQLHEAASLAGVSADTAIAQICAEPLRVLTIGFAPGQPYLGPLPPNWDIPRQTGLTKQVPMGAITVAIRQIVLFAGPSPTGWRQIGQCNFRLFRPAAPSPFVLGAGDEVQFRAVDRQTFTTLHGQSPDGGATWEALP